MHSFCRRFPVGLLLPLFLLAGLLGHGGWFCADGSYCAPALAITCCCGCPEGTVAIRDACCADERGAEEGDALSTGSCGCYYQADDAALSALHPPQILNDLAIGQQASRETAVVSPSALIARLPTEAPSLKSRVLLSARDPRGPPTA